MLIEEHEDGPWPFYVYLCGYGNFRPAFKGAASSLDGAKEIGARADYCRQFPHHPMYKARTA